MRWYFSFGKGAKDRVTMLAAELVEPLRKHLEWVRQQHERDLADGIGHERRV